MLIVFIRPIINQGIEELSRLYQEVFSGFPYYEDKICEGALDKDNPCNLQYTKKKLPLNFKPADLDRRVGVVGSTDRANCQACGRRLVDFYPNVVDQGRLINEAISEAGFIGYALEKEGRVLGFTWGYRLPSRKTISVDFMEVRRLLDDVGVEPNKTFYCAELGIIESARGNGLGLLLSTERIYEAAQKGFSDLVVRTKNPAILAIGKRLFGVEARMLFQDPERDYPWYGWKFNGFSKKEDLFIMGAAR